MRSKGWELAVTWSDKIGKDIRYNIGLNLYDSRSKITKYSNDDNLLTYTDASDNNIEKCIIGKVWNLVKSGDILLIVSTRKTTLSMES